MADKEDNVVSVDSNGALRTKTEDEKSTPPSEEVYQQSFPVHEHKIGWIIGKGGSYVKQLQQKSGATIVVSNTKSVEYGQTWKYLQITGNGRSIDRAKKLLIIRLDRLEQSDGPAAAGADDTGDNGASFTETRHL